MQNSKDGAWNNMLKKFTKEKYMNAIFAIKNSLTEQVWDFILMQFMNKNIWLYSLW